MQVFVGKTAWQQFCFERENAILQDFLIWKCNILQTSVLHIPLSICGKFSEEKTR